ncbi:MAG: leucine-rich repeat protein [Lachnospiraceae bacterium]|nr:leucine-rich repeat protein [Lachnospiraceae bacterium]
MKYKKILCGMLLAVLAAQTLEEGMLVNAASIEKTVSINASLESDFEFDAASGTVTKYLGSSRTVSVPDEILGTAVTSIGIGAFSSNEMLESVAIPESVTRIEAEAFLNCPNLREVKIPDGVTKIEALAFFMCESLEDVDFGNGVTTIGKNAFYGCAGLDDIDLPDTVTTIEAHAFMECRELEEMELPYGVTTIEQEAFRNCVSLTEITIPSSVQTLEDQIFSGAEQVKILCEKGSVAYAYGQNSGIPIEEIQIKLTPTDTLPSNTPTIAPTKVPTQAAQDSVYHISYVLKGGKFENTAVDEYDGTYSIRLPKPVRKGYNFIGWYTESSYINQVTIIKKGSTGDKKLYAKWEKVQKPSRPVISSVKNNKSKQMTVKLKKKVSGAAGYEMVYATNQKFTQNKKTVRFASLSKTVKKLEKGKKYYVKVRAYKTDSTGSRVYGSYCLIPKTVKINK